MENEKLWRIPNGKYLKGFKEADKMRVGGLTIFKVEMSVKSRCG